MPLANILFGSCTASPESLEAFCVLPPYPFPTFFWVPAQLPQNLWKLSVFCLLIHSLHPVMQLSPYRIWNLWKLYVFSVILHSLHA